MTLEAWVEVLPDLKALGRDRLNPKISATMSSAGVAGSSAFSGSFLSGVGQVFGGTALYSLAAGAGRLIGEAIGGAISYGLEGIDLASNLGETRSAIQQVFQGASTDIEAFAATANKRLGQTQVQALRGAQTFGVFAKAAGLTDKPLSDFSTGLVELATDLGSFYNTSADEAIEAIGAGLRGEAEPLRRFGVLLDDATLRNRALTLGIYDGTGALTSQQRILAAQAEIFAQTSIAQGDFARTSGGLAGQQKILEASLLDAQTALGTALLPGFTRFVDYANTTIIPRLGEVIDRVGPQLASALEKSGPLFEEFLNFASDGLEGIALWLDGAATIRTELENFGYDIGEAGFTLSPSLGLGMGTDFDLIISDLDAKATAGGTQISQSYYDAVIAGSTRSQLGAILAQELQASIDSGATVVADSNPTGPHYIGSMFVEGVGAGVESKAPELIKRIEDLGGKMGSALNRTLDINSPSRVGMRIGGYFSEGVAIGVAEQAHLVTDQVHAMGAGMAGMNVPSIGMSGTGASVAGSRSGGNTIQLINDDPYVLLGMLEQKLDAKLETL